MNEPIEPKYAYKHIFPAKGEIEEHPQDAIDPTVFLAELMRATEIEEKRIAKAK